MNKKSPNLKRVTCSPLACREIPLKEIQTALWRHRACNWDKISRRDSGLTDGPAVSAGLRMSSYISGSGLKFWVVTEMDHLATAVLLSSEF